MLKYNYSLFIGMVQLGCWVAIPLPRSGDTAMNYTEALDLAADLIDESREAGTGWTYAAVQAHNSDTWAALGHDEEGVPTDLWVSPGLSFPL